MHRFLTAVSLLALLSACGDGQPFFDPLPDGGTGGGTDGGTDGGGIGGDTDLPPGTTSPSSASTITRYEDRNDSNGGGYVSSVAYNAANDTFAVDGLAFDGANVYNRVSLPTIASLGNYAVYEGTSVELDPVSGAPIPQFVHRAIYGVSTNTVDVGGVATPRSRFAIVRTGAYVPYGFGGFVYERTGSVTLPPTGQATYAGDYAGIRVFNPRQQLEYTSARMQVSVDFRDFNGTDGRGVTGQIYDRHIYDSAGVEIITGTGTGQLAAPDISFAVGPGVSDDNGELSGQLGSFLDDGSGALEAYEQGVYYGIIGGSGADEIVGIIVIESDDPRYTGVTAQETGGFIVYR